MMFLFPTLSMVRKIFYPHKSISETINDIIIRPEIYSLTYIQYPPRLIAKPHRDYNPYGKKFKKYNYQ